MKMKKKDRMVKLCEYCDKEYEPILINGIWKRQKYCSPKCREAAWHNKNPSRGKELRYKSYIRNRRNRICKICNEPMQRKGKNRICDNCRPIQKERQYKRNNEKRRKIQTGFTRFKETIGCQKCKYNKCGACLDFHHSNGKKEKRINASLWKSWSEKFRKELAKCSLLCKNCHHELHYIGKDKWNFDRILEQEMPDWNWLFGTKEYPDFISIPVTIGQSKKKGTITILKDKKIEENGDVI